ncbi:MAG: hypothetical protein IJX02_03540 [Clostridia bacterium]|nr:hypothetical protein [Clostridia bacterium]
MTCVFFGHSIISNDIRASLKSKIIELFQNGVHTFYVGNNGQFDYLVQIVLEEASVLFSDLKYEIVLSRLDEKAISGNQRATVFPEELACVLPKFAISKRNDWLIKKADIVVCYITNKLTNSYKWVEKAQKRNLTILNIFDQSLSLK